MKNIRKQILAAAMATCLSLGLVTTANAYRWETDADLMGKMVQNVVDYENNNYGLYVVHLLPVGTVIKCDESVNVSIYAEGEYGAYAPKAVANGVTSYTISDTANTYVVTGADGGMALFRGAASQQTPITLVGDFEMGNVTLKLSKPVVDITVDTYLETDFWTGESYQANYLVYEVPVGTTVEYKFGADSIMLRSMWDTENASISGADYEKLAKQQFPGVEIMEDFGLPMLPLTLNEVGYSYGFAPEALACNLPVIKVVDEQPSAYTPRVAQFTDMNWSKSYVDKVYAYGWMDGMGGGKFAPDSNLTVAQALTLAARLHSVQCNEPIPTSDGPWYQTYVDYCKNNGLLYNFYDSWSGDDALMARINDKATRMDMIKILSGAIDLPGLSWNEEESISIPDVNKDADEGGYLVYDWYRNGILAGDPGTGAFRPNDSIKRGEVAVILCKLLGL